MAGSRSRWSRRVELLLVAALCLGNGAASQEGSPSALEVARTAERSGDLARARDVLERALEAGETNERVRLELGLLYERLGARERAVATFRGVLAASPENEEARRALERLGAIGWQESEVLERAEAALERQLWREAAYLFERHLRSDPASARALLGLARCREETGRAEEAVALYRRALETPAARDAARARLDALLGQKPQEEAAPDTAAVPPAREPQEAGSPVESTADVSADRAGDEAQAEPQTQSRAATAETASPPPEVAATPRSTAPARVPSEPGPTAARGSAKLQVQDPSSEQVAIREPESSALLGEAAPEATPEQGSDSRPSVAGGDRHAAWWYAGGALAVLVAAVAAGVLWRRRRPSRRYTLAGRLDQLPLHDVLQLIGIERKTGVLEVESQGGAGAVRIQQGRIVNAEAGEARGKPALFAILSLSEGDFSFFEEALSPTIRHELSLPVERALMEWAKAVDDARRDDSEAGGLEEISIEALNQDLPF